MKLFRVKKISSGESSNYVWCPERELLLPLQLSLGRRGRKGGSTPLLPDANHSSSFGHCVGRAHNRAELSSKKIQNRFENDANAAESKTLALKGVRGNHVERTERKRHFWGRLYSLLTLCNQKKIRKEKEKKLHRR